MARKDRTPGKRDGRRPLIAGNWKINLTTSTPSAWSRSSRSASPRSCSTRSRSWCCRRSPLCAASTLITGDKLRIGYGAQDLSSTTRARTPARSPARCSRRSVPVRHGRPLRAAGLPRRGRRGGRAKRRRSRHGIVPIVCVGEGLEIRAGRRARRALLRAARRLPRRADRRADGRRCGRLRAGLGDRHRRGGDAGGRAGGLRRAPGAAGRAVRPETAPASVSSTAGR